MLGTYICIKTCFVKKANTGVIFLKLEPYYRVDVLYKNAYIDAKSRYFFEVDKNLYSIPIEDFFVNFVSLGVWRDKQIDEILDDNNLY